MPSVCNRYIRRLSGELRNCLFKYTKTFYSQRQPSIYINYLALFSFFLFYFANTKITPSGCAVSIRSDIVLPCAVRRSEITLLHRIPEDHRPKRLFSPLSYKKIYSLLINFVKRMVLCDMLKFEKSCFK